MANCFGATSAGNANTTFADALKRSRHVPGPGSSTRSPGFTCVTLEPTAAMRPTPSAPGFIGRRGGSAPYLPSRFSTSAGLIGTNSASISTSPGPGAPGSGCSTSSITLPGSPNVDTCAISMSGHHPCEPFVGKRQPVDERVQQRGRQLQLAVLADLLQRGGLELGEDDLGGRDRRCLARHRARLD